MESTEQDTENVKIKKRILDWAAPCFPLEIREEAVQAYQDFIRGKQTEELDFYASALVFGTGGLRGVIGNGAGRMNQWTVGKTTLGFSRFLKSRSKKPSLVIAHDSRRMSPEFARAAAGVAAQEGVRVYLFDGVAPTPLLSYAIRHLKASGGVVITASHNPPEYNGYKVYLEDGAQLAGPAQKELEDAIGAIEDWSQVEFLDSDSPEYAKWVTSIGGEIKKSYIREFKGCSFVSPSSSPSKKDLKIVYSPLHGTGGPWLPALLEAYGFQVSLVAEQAEPDGEFPTVRYPNPEEAEALRLTEETARRLDADIFLATDPDADRLGAGVKTKSGSYELLNGNQIGSIMCAYLCEKTSAASKKEASEKTPHILKTIVTTDLQREIALKNGAVVKDVLTGFKFIAEQMRFIEEGKRKAGYSSKDYYLFGGEESYGYLPVDFVRDKDSLASALLLCEIAAREGDLISYLNQVYLKYGLFLEDLKSVTLKGSAGQKKIQETIEKLRNSDLLSWTLGERRVQHVLDYETQTRDGQPFPEGFAGMPPSNVLQLILEPEGKLTIRPSGTEPKVKLYASLRHPNQPSSLEELERGKKELEDELVLISGSFFARAGLAG